MSTAVQLLESALDEYRKAEAELTSYRQKADKSQHEAQSAIENNEVSEGAASAKVALAHVLRERLKSRELGLHKTLDELGKTTTLASQQLNSEVMELWIKRRSVIGKRAIEALQATEDLVERGVLDEALSFSGPLLAVRAFGVQVYNAQYIEKVSQKAVQFVTSNVGDLEVQEEVTTDREPVIRQTLDVQHLIASAELVLENFEKLTSESEREI